MRNTGFIIFLNFIRNRHAQLVGAKAFGLARMAKSGLPVPPGFCITGSAYRQHISLPILARLLDSRLPELDRSNMTERAKILDDIRQTITASSLSDGLTAQITEAFESLAAKRVAVRSSATAEDLPGHSFAGQYDTYLRIETLQNCLHAIKKCWASVWTTRAYEYRRSNGFDHLKMNMAVIVQSLIEPDVSGVVFTVDPLKECKSRIIIEAVSGLGDSLVSGKAAPQRFVLDKKNLNIISHTIPAPEADEQLSESPKDKTFVNKLAKLAIKVESKFGCPQDIEWAFSNNQIYLLQSRPITTLTQAKSQQDNYIWSSFATKEVMPDVVTPVSKSIIDTLCDIMFDPLFDALCIDRADVPIYDYFAGRIYFNASFWASVVRAVPGSERYDWNRFAGSNPDVNKMNEMFDDMTDNELPNIKTNRIRLILKIPFLIAEIISCTPKKGQAILARTKQKNQKWKHLNISTLSNEEVATFCKKLIDDFHDVLRDAPYLFGTMVAYPALQIVCTKWLSDETYAGRLLAGIGNIDDAQAATDLWKLALKANELPELKERILKKDSWHSIAAEISRLPHTDEFLKSWNDFMSDHGHHCRAELELYNPRWSESPDYILGLLRGYICCIEKTDPLENYEKVNQQRHFLEQQCRRKLKNPIKRLIFNHLLVRSHNGAVFRENIKSEIIKLLATVRKLLVELGGRLHAGDVLSDPDDVFFLTLDEIETIVSGHAELKVKNIIAARRVEHDRNNLLTLPDLIIGEFDPDSCFPEHIEIDFQVLKGLAVSPGITIGKAKVILRTDGDTQLEASEILVAPFTDPGWTPYFIPAAGVITEQGGILSHGSIVARELGIPAVTNVGHATKVIKTGRTIRIDGNSGTVTML